METNYALITEGFGHGFASLNFAAVNNLHPIAFSTKEDKESFTAEVNQIYNNLIAFAPDMLKANWEDRETFLTQGWNVRKDIVTGNISPEIWQKFANHKLTAKGNNLPQFSGLTRKNNILFIPQKLKSDGFCGITASQQSLPLEIFDFLKNDSKQLVLGQHFHKVNDLDTVKTLAESFNLYVPGMTEDESVFGIRGVRHINYRNLYAQLNGSIGIAGTHTWIMLTCFPEIPQIILFNTKGIERWKEIEKAYQATGYPVYCLGFNENTDLQEFAEEIATLYLKLF